MLPSAMRVALAMSSTREAASPTVDGFVLIFAVVLLVSLGNPTLGLGVILRSFLETRLSNFE